MTQDKARSSKRKTTVAKSVGGHQLPRGQIKKMCKKAMERK